MENGKIPDMVKSCMKWVDDYKDHILKIYEIRKNRMSYRHGVNITKASITTIIERNNTLEINYVIQGWDEWEYDCINISWEDLARTDYEEFENEEKAIYLALVEEDKEKSRKRSEASDWKKYEELKKKFGGAV